MIRWTQAMLAVKPREDSGFDSDAVMKAAIFLVIFFGLLISAIAQSSGCICPCGDSLV